MSNIREVAQKAGVSIATASRILSNDDTFKTTEATRQKVLAATKELNYIFCPRKKAAPKLHIGCILPLTSEKYSDPFFTSILLSIEEECNEQNATVSAIRNCNELQNPQLLEELCGMRLDGLVLMEEIPENILDIIRKHVPHLIAIDQPDSEFNTIGFDHIHANTLVMKHLLQRGYRRIAYIGGSSPYFAMLNSFRLMVYREELRKHHIPYDESIIRDCCWDLDLCAKCAEELLLSPNRPDAIFAGSDTLASVILSVIYRLGLKCPDDVGVIGFNNLDLSAHTAPPLTTVNIPTKAIGKCAASRLIGLIRTNDPLIMKINLPTDLVVRESTARESTAPVSPTPPAGSQSSEGPHSPA